MACCACAVDVDLDVDVGVDVAVALAGLFKVRDCLGLGATIVASAAAGLFIVVGVSAMTGVV